MAPAPDSPTQTLYRVYSAADDIPYAPESALKEGLGMVNTIKNSLQKLKLGSKLREEVWSREMERCAFNYLLSHYIITLFLAFKTKAHLLRLLLYAVVRELLYI
jgi:hypothetical protein